MDLVARPRSQKEVLFRIPQGSARFRSVRNYPSARNLQNMHRNMKMHRKMRKSRFPPYGFQMAELRLNSCENKLFFMFRIFEKPVSNENLVWNETGLGEAGFE